MSKKTKAPNDLELMQLVDGELAEGRAEELWAFLEGTSDEAREARDKVMGLTLVGDVVRRGLADPAASFDVADAVLARISSHDSGAGTSANEAERADEAEKADALADVIALPRGRGAGRRDGPSVLERRARHRENRMVVGFVAFAVAAAAAVTIWGRLPAEPEKSAHLQAPITASTVEEPPPLPPVAIATASGAPEPAPVAEREPAVSVTAVDFGSRNGSVFYVPTDAADGAVTTVVWIGDDGP